MKNERSSNSNLVLFGLILFFISFFAYNSFFFNLFDLNRNKISNLNQNYTHESNEFDELVTNFTLLNAKCKHSNY